MRKLKRALFWLLVVLILFGTFLGYLGASSGHPRASAGWIRLPDMPDARGEFGAAVAGRADCVTEGCGATRIIAAGGIGLFGRTVRTVSVYDVVSQTWSGGPPLPEPRHHPGVASGGAVLYVSGGSKKSANWKPESNFWILTAGAKKWTVGPSMPEGRMAHQMVTVGSRLYVVGGRGKTSNVLIFDTLTSKWSIGAQMPVPRDHLACAVVGTTIFAIGGRDTGLLDRVDVYDTIKDAWKPGPALPAPMSAMAAGTLSDGIHVVGGENPRTLGGGVIRRHYVLSAVSGKWETASRELMPTHGSAFVVYSDSLIVIGGARRQGALSPLGWTGLVQAYSPSNSRQG